MNATKAKHSEIDAMKMVEQAFDDLDAEARQRVFNWAASRYGLANATTASGNTFTGVTGANQPNKATNAQTVGTPKDIKAFLTAKRPENFYERIACLAYYLEKFESQTELKTRNITKANTDSRLPKMTNPALFVKHATFTYGYLASLAHGKFGISTRGEALVEALPDRDRVAEALTQNPFRKGKKKAPKATKK